MGAAEGVAPQRDPAGIEVVASPDPCDRGPEVLLLAREVDDLAWLAAALAEAAIVEHQGGDPAGGEPFGVGEQPVHRPAEAVREDDTRPAGVGVCRRLGKEQVAGAGVGA
jgi:hypothetical protein